MNCLPMLYLPVLFCRAASNNPTASSFSLFGIRLDLDKTEGSAKLLLGVLRVRCRVIPSLYFLLKSVLLKIKKLLRKIFSTASLQGPQEYYVSDF